MFSHLEAIYSSYGDSSCTTGAAAGVGLDVSIRNEKKTKTKEKQGLGYEKRGQETPSHHKQSKSKTAPHDVKRYGGPGLACTKPAVHLQYPHLHMHVKMDSKTTRFGLGSSRQKSQLQFEEPREKKTDQA